MPAILLATDLSPYSDRALARALWLARRDERQFCVLHVIPPDADDPERCEAEARSRLDRVLAEQAPDLRLDMAVRQGLPSDEVASSALALGAELVVLGRHRGEAAHDTFEPPTASLLCDGPPVVQAINAHSGPWRRVVVGTDFSAGARRALDKALAVAGEAEVHLVHAFEAPLGGLLADPADMDALLRRHRAELERLAAEVSKATGGRVSAFTVARGAVATCLAGEAARLEADLLVVGCSGSGGAEFGPAAAALTADPPSDVMVVPSPCAP